MNDSSPSAGVWFPQWADVLAGVRLKDLERRAYRLAIVEYLSFCKRSRQRATVASARMFMAQVEGRRRLGKSQLAVWKGALNWFFQMAKTSRIRPESAPADPPARPCAWKKEPPLAASDTGGPVWERRLIRELRGRHYEWRTEQAYRMWCRRFDEWLGARGGGVMAAGEIELREFLSDLATRQRAAAATQKQALNALVFLMREALGKVLEDFGDYARARNVKRLPVVLSRMECQRLLGSLEGTWRLMAQVLYGTGLRLLELLRLRVHDIDFERNQIIVCGGKGSPREISI